MNLFRLSLLSLLLTTFVTHATEVGDPAPPLAVNEWVKGGPIELTNSGSRVYVIDFWATWSPACRSSIAHLTELQQQFKAQGLIVVGIADESLPSVQPMVQEMGEKMMYAVGVDDKHQTSEAYLRTYGVGGIPHSFVINQQGKVVWHGHPFSELRSVLVQVLSKNFDPAKARVTSELEKQVVRYLQLSAGEKPTAAMYDLGATIVKEGARNPELLNHLAWSVLSTPSKAQDLDLAKQAAKAAYEGTKGQEPAIADTYARALMEKGELEEAVKVQKEAVARASKGRQKDQLQKTLEGYQKKLAGPGTPKSP